MRIARSGLLLLPLALLAPVVRADERPASNAPASNAPAIDGFEDDPVVAPAAAVAPSVTIGVPQWVRGGALTKGIREAIAARLPIVEACERGAIDRGDAVDGALTLRLAMLRADGSTKALAAGHIESAVTTESEAVSAEVRTCVRDAFVGVDVGMVGTTPIEATVSIAFDRGTTSFASVTSKSACAAEVDGEMTDTLRVALRARATKASLCFRRAPLLGEPATLKAGTIELHLRVAADGSVCGAYVVGDSFDRASLTSCVLEEMGRDYEAEPDGALDVIVPISFKGT